MTHSEFRHILNSLNGLSPEQMQRLRRELESKLSASPAAPQPDADPLLGSMSDHAELMDQIVEDAMRNREQQPWRLATSEYGTARHRYAVRDRQGQESGHQRQCQDLPAGIRTLFVLDRHGPRDRQGIPESPAAPRLHAFMASIASEEVFPLDTVAAELAGRITGDLDRIGQPIGRADPIIAAIAIDQGLELVTGNTAHYQRIQQLGYPLTLVNWR